MWAEAFLSSWSFQSCSYDEFLGELKKKFAHLISEGINWEIVPVVRNRGNTALCHTSSISLSP